MNILSTAEWESSIAALREIWPTTLLADKEIQERVEIYNLLVGYLRRLPRAVTFREFQRVSGCRAGIFTPILDLQGDNVLTFSLANGLEYKGPGSKFQRVIEPGLKYLAPRATYLYYHALVKAGEPLTVRELATEVKMSFNDINFHAAVWATLDAGMVEFTNKLRLRPLRPSKA